MKQYGISWDKVNDEKIMYTPIMMVNKINHSVDLRRFGYW